MFRYKPPDNEEELRANYVTKQQVAKILNITTVTIKKMLRRRLLVTAFRKGRKSYFRRQEVYNLKERMLGRELLGGILPRLNLRLTRSRDKTLGKPGRKKKNKIITKIRYRKRKPAKGDIIWAIDYIHQNRMRKNW